MRMDSVEGMSLPNALVQRRSLMEYTCLSNAGSGMAHQGQFWGEKTLLFNPSTNQGNNVKLFHQYIVIVSCMQQSQEVDPINLKYIQNTGR